MNGYRTAAFEVGAQACLVPTFKKQGRLCWEWKKLAKPGFESFPRRHYPDRVRGYLLSPTSWSTPVSVNTIETPFTTGMQIDGAHREW